QQLRPEISPPQARLASRSSIRHLGVAAQTPWSFLFNLCQESPASIQRQLWPVARLLLSRSWARIFTVRTPIPVAVARGSNGTGPPVPQVTGGTPSYRRDSPPARLPRRERQPLPFSLRA